MKEKRTIRGRGKSFIFNRQHKVQKSLMTFLGLFLLVSALASAQNFQLKGFVQDSSGLSLPSAHIQIWSPKKKVITSDASGEFVLSLPAGEVRVDVSYTGFKKLSHSFILSSATVIGC